MAEGAYELLALGMRYVFVLIGLLILWRAFRWIRRDAKNYQKEMRSLPDAGLVGEMVDLRTGRAQPLPRDGTIGASRECDIRVKGAGVKHTHALFAFEEGKGLKITPSRGARVLLSGAPVKGSGHALHGTQLQVGDAMLRVRLFAGLNVPFPAAYPQDAPDIPLDNFYSYDDQAEADVSPALPFPAPGFAQAEDQAPFSFPGGESAPPADPGYEGNYTDDGQMTWQYAYSLEELRRAQADLDAAQNDADEALPYQSPIPRRRRRQRHG